MVEVSIGSLVVSSWALIIASCILLATVIATLYLKRFLDLHFQHFRHILDIKVSRYRFIRHFLTGLLVAIGIGLAIYVIPGLRAISVSIFAGAGVLAIIVGFAAQQTLSNMISGIFIAIFKPFRVGDWVHIQDKYGTVEDITLRHTIIRNPENKRVIIPNSIISEQIIENSSIHDKRICKWVEMSISYDSDIDKALSIMQEEAMRHPAFLDVRTHDDKKAGIPAVKAKVIGFGDSSVNLRAWVWTRDIVAAYNLGWDLHKSIKERFDKDGIEIPFPYRTLVYKKEMRRER